MATYTSKTELAQTDLEDIPYGIDRYCLSIPNIRMLRGGVARETAYFHARRWRQAGYAELQKGGYVTFTQRAFFHFDPPFTYHKFGTQNLAHHAEVNMVEFWLRERKDMVVLGTQGQRMTRHMLKLPPEDPVHPSRHFRSIHIPDLIVDILSTNTGKIVQTAIDVERSYKGPDRTEWFLKELASSYEQSFVIAAEGNGVYRCVKACIENLPDEMIPRIHLWKLDSIRVWQETQFSLRGSQPSTNGQSEE